jgi:hypothetical protein
MEDEVANGKLPLNGLQDLQRACVAEIDEWASSINETSIITEIEYKRFVSLLYATLYCFSPQGRKGNVILYLMIYYIIYIRSIDIISYIFYDKGGMESLTYKDRIDLSHKNVATSLKFKTAQFHGKQFILCDLTYGKKLFDIYIKFIRPKVNYYICTCII